MSVQGVGELTEYFAHNHLRPSQEELLKDCVSVLTERGFILAAAPTGIGKTAASLAAAIKIVKQSSEEMKIMFLTGRQSQHKIVVDTVKSINSKIKSRSNGISLVDIIGREGMCDNIQPMTGECSCEIDIDERTKKIGRIKLTNMILEEPLHVEDIIKRAKKMNICPWATARLAAKSSDIIVCDYNHIFIESVMERSLTTMGVALESTIIIVDEAHNLPDRIRNGLERIVWIKTFQDSYFEVEEYLGTREKEIKKIDVNDTYGSKEIEDISKLKVQINKLRKDMKKWFRDKENLLSDKNDLKIETSEFLGVINESLMESLIVGENGDYAIMKKMVNQLFNVKVEVDDSSDLEQDENTACSKLGYMLSTCIEYRNSPALALVIDKITESETIRVRSYLLDPGVISGPLFDKTRGAIIMSGTLFPPGMYTDILQIPLEKKVIAKEYKSDFLSNKRPILIARDVTTKFTSRGLKNTMIMKEHIESAIKNSVGHVALFFPSYMMQEKILEERSWIPWGIETIVERRMMSKDLVAKSVERLHNYRNKNQRCILIGVLGGKFSEGVDYPDNILETVICVGLPLAPPSARQDALKSYYEARFGNILSWRYTSSQPAVNSLMQAIGRPIRKSEDRALIILLENRLLNRNYRLCMPDSLQITQTSNPDRTKKFTKSFFQHYPKPGI